MVTADVNVIAPRQIIVPTTTNMVLTSGSLWVSGNYLYIRSENNVMKVSGAYIY